MSRTPTAYGLLTARRDQAQPFLTHYAGPASRIELSVASTANGVAKAAGLLRDGLGLEPGATVSVDLPRHWQLPVWVLAALSVGARCGRELPGPVQVRVVGPDGIRAGLAGANLAADDVLASACDPFGMPVREGLPGGVLDVAVEARAFPDVFAPEGAAADHAALVGDVGLGGGEDGQDVAWAELVRAAEAPREARRWLDESVEPGALLRACLTPVLDGGSLVIATGLSAQDTARIRALERVTEPGP